MSTEDIEITVEGTPNPNAAKFVLNHEIPCGGSKSYLGAAAAADNPLAARLFAIDGVRALLFVENFITVTKTPEADWETVVGRVEETIRAGLEL